MIPARTFAASASDSSSVVSPLNTRYTTCFSTIAVVVETVLPVRVVRVLVVADTDVSVVVEVVIDGASDGRCVGRGVGGGVGARVGYSVPILGADVGAKVAPGQVSLSIIRLPLARCLRRQDCSEFFGRAPPPGPQLSVGTAPKR
jgi:hypothetical protein